MNFTGSDLIIERKRRDYAWSMHKVHLHDRYEIYYLVSGKRTVVCDKTIYELLPGDVMLFRPNILHKGSGSAEHEKYGAEFSHSFLSCFFTEQMQKHLLRCFKYGFIRLNEQERHGFERIYLKMLSEYEEDKLFSVSLAALLLLLDSAGQRCERESHELRRLTSAPPGAAELIITYIEEHYRDIRSVDEIAESIHLDKSYLCRLFKRKTGMTVMDYLQHFRIQNACEFLTSTDNKISDIAGMCGFENTSHFIRLFKKLIGSTPGQFRKACGGTALYPITVRTADG